MSSEAFALVQEVHRSGATVSVLDDGGLELRGDVPEELVDRLRERKSEIVALLCIGVATRKVDPALWASMRSLGPSLGRAVEVGPPWGMGTLWGVTPHGAIVDVGPVLITFNHKDVR